MGGTDLMSGLAVMRFQSQSWFGWGFSEGLSDADILMPWIASLFRSLRSRRGSRWVCEVPTVPGKRVVFILRC